MTQDIHIPPKWALDESESKERDTGKHYRYNYKVRVTQNDFVRGFVNIKLDPYRISLIYNILDPALDQIVKKALCAGKRGHNDLREELKDIICAAERRLEILDEDEYNGQADSSSVI